ncbi:MAG TPA: nucleotidyltransferase family protein [Candidatus Nanopelagicaceae bacterium]|nr:nucleotidyltransferase family protein [Candidatus Nanopelagicaceae bacterium]
MTRLEQLRAQSEEIRRIGARHKATAIAVFGSVARGEDGPDSDIDFLVDFESGSSLFDICRLQDELEALLGISVDVVSRGGLKPRDTRIRAEALPL